jgi:hypothetical protein
MEKRLQRKIPTEWTSTVKKNVREGADLVYYLANKNPIPTMLSAYALTASVGGRLAVKNGTSRKMFDSAVVKAGSSVVWGGVGAAKIVEVHGGGAKTQLAAGASGTAITVALMRKFGVGVVSRYTAPVGIATMLGDTASRTTKALGGGKVAEIAGFWGVTAAVAGAMIKVGARANVPMLIGSLAFSVGQHFYNKYKDGQRRQTLQNMTGSQLVEAIGDKTPEQIATMDFPTDVRQRIDQAARGAAASVGSLALTVGGARAVQSAHPNMKLGGRAGVLTGLALGLYGLMMGGNARAEGLRQVANRPDQPVSPPVHKTGLQINLGTKGPSLADRLPGLRASHPSDGQLEHDLAQMRAGIHKMTHAGGEEMARPVPSKGPPSDATNLQINVGGGDRPGWSDQAREAALLARNASAAYQKNGVGGKVSAVGTPKAKPATAPTKKRRSAHVEQKKTGKVKYTRNGKTRFRARPGEGKKNG